MFQNQWELGTTLNWVKGRHTISFGGSWDHTQLNIINNNTNTDSIGFKTFVNFVEGTVRTGSYSAAFSGAASRYYRSDTVGAFVNDNCKVRSNLNVTLGLRWDFDGPLTEKYGKLTGVQSEPVRLQRGHRHHHQFRTGNRRQQSRILGTPGASDSLLTQRQWGLAPRIGVAWSPKPKIDRARGLRHLLRPRRTLQRVFAQRRRRLQRPVRRHPGAAVRHRNFRHQGRHFLDSFRHRVRSRRRRKTRRPSRRCCPISHDTESAIFPRAICLGRSCSAATTSTTSCRTPMNWTFDIQYQASNNWLFSAGYVGNHGVHEVLPIPFNQPRIATAQNPVNGQTISYGGVTPLYLDTEPFDPAPEYAGNAPVRVPYIGYDMNSVSYEAEGISNYNALQLQARKRFSNGLQFTASYTWSHALDEQSGLGLFFTGNNPLNPKSNYASADFDQTHVFLINYSYTIPKLTSNQSLGYLVNGWTIGGQTVAQSGQPYSVYDYSGSVASLYYGTSDYITNPIVPLAPGVTAKQAQLQGTTGVNPNNPVLNATDFAPPFVAPGTNGVPACDASGCDNYESLFGSTGRNLFRGPFQVRFDMTLGKEFLFSERYRLRFNFDAFNIFNHPDFDAPNNDVLFFPYYTGPPQIPPDGSLGYIQHTIGSPRFLQLSLHLMF